MNGILDTHTFIWWDSDADQLSDAARSFVLDPENTVLLSVVSVWEMVIKHALGKLHLQRPLEVIVQEQQDNDIRILPIRLDHVLTVGNLIPIHNDPFDRLLVAQAIVEDAVLLTSDPLMARYPVRTIW